MKPDEDSALHSRSGPAAFRYEGGVKPSKLDESVIVCVIVPLELII